MISKKPFSRKWTPLFCNALMRRIKVQHVLSKARIKNISNGLTMPDIENVSIGSGKRMEAAILFFDLENFTSISSKLQNEQVLLILNTIIPQMMHVVKHWNGEIEKKYWRWSYGNYWH